MDDDFNTPVAVAELQGFRSAVNKLLETGLSTKAKEQARQLFRLSWFRYWAFSIGELAIQMLIISDIGVIGLGEEEIEVEK